jgi:hypothetical protein
LEELEPEHEGGEVVRRSMGSGVSRSGVPGLLHKIEMGSQDSLEHLVPTGSKPSQSESEFPCSSMLMYNNRWSVRR